MRTWIRNERLTHTRRLHMRGVADGIHGASVATGVRYAPTARPASIVDTTTATPICPACQSPMVLRTARKGPNAGNQFWGCSGYPGCRITASLSAR